MANTTVPIKIDLAASLARISSARELAEFQARMVDSTEGGVGYLDLDLLFLTQESVLVFEETHRMLVALAAQEKSELRVGLYRPIEHRSACKEMERPAARRRVAVALSLIVAVLVSAFLLEIIDPAPMDVAASTSSFPRAGQ